jgi:endo-1,4-beta-xylanase
MGDVMRRRSVVLGAVGAGVAAELGGWAGLAPAAHAGTLPDPLWRQAKRNGIAFGTAMSTRLDEDAAYVRLVNREAAVLFAEDDLLWYKLKPTPESPLDFSYADQLMAAAEAQGQEVVGAHLVWDEGFGEGWTEDDLWGLSEPEARALLFGTIRAEVRRYRGRMAAWIVTNEVTDPEGVDGVRTNVPWHEAIGPSYIAEAFELAHDEDPGAVLILNEFGFETVNEFGDRPEDRQQATLQVLDALLADGVPVHALGVQAHLLADRFATRFNPQRYKRFLAQVADRGVAILITELDVLDDGLPADIAVRDQAIADVYRRYLDAALDETAVKAVLAFGLSDRHTWLEEDFPREDGAPRRPLPYDADLAPKPAYHALGAALRNAPCRQPIRW